MTTRIFLLGVVLLFLGLQLRSFETFVLNEQVSKVLTDRAMKKQVEQADDPLEAGFALFADTPTVKAVVAPKNHRITPPRWLGYSFLSIGAVLVCSCPLCRR